MPFNIKVISIALNSKPTDVASSNRLLRALWASLRQEFGNLGWCYQPVRDGDNRQIYFGLADISILSPILVGVTYKQRGIISHILFEDKFADKSDPIISRIESCVRTAETANESDFFMTSEIIMPSGYLFQDLNELNIFSLLTIGNRTSLTLGFSAFDKYDAEHNFNLCARPIVDVLSAFSNLFFGISKPNFSSSSCLDDVQRPEYNLGVDWIDGYPMIDGKIAMPDHCLKLIRDIARNNINKDKQLILDACHHFHSARSLEQQACDFSRTETSSEMAMVLYISCLEVLSSINAPSPETCRTCSQPKYRISTRVEEFVAHHLGAYPADMVKNIYNERSKYLHTGRLLSSRSATRTIIPQLDSSANNGVRSPISTLHINLREFTSYCIRAVTYDLYNR